MPYNTKPTHIPEHIDTTGAFTPSKRFRPTSPLQNQGNVDDSERNDFVLAQTKDMAGTPKRDLLDGESVKFTPPKVVSDLDYNAENKL